MSLNKFRIFILASFLGLSATAAAQQRTGGGPGAGHSGNPSGSLKLSKISGTVIDKSTSKPVEYANVTILRAKDSTFVTGGISDNAGKFALDKIPYGLYTVKIKFIGYSTSVVRDVKATQPTTEIGKVEINPSTKNLAEVTVTGHKSEVQNNLDKKVYNIDKSMYGTGGTALDIMQSLPAVAVDFDGNVSMRGSSVTILIDGRPSNLVSLDQMPAHLIEKVEVISNPSAKYDPEGVSGIINIVLKKNVQRGLNGVVNLNVGWNSKWMGNASLNYRRNKLNFFTNYTLRSFHGDSYQDFWSDNTFNSKNTYQQKNTSTINNFTMQNIQVGVDYFLNSKNTIGTSFTLEPRNNNSKDSTSGFFNEDGNRTYLDRSYDYGRRTWSRSNNNGGFEYDLNYKHTFNREGAELTADFNIDRGNNESEQGSVESYTKAAAQPSSLDQLPPYSYIITNTTNDNIRTLFRTDFVLPMDEYGRIETGYQISNNDSKSNYDLSKTLIPNTQTVHLPLYDNDFRYKQMVNALYLIYGNSLGKFKLQGGLRAEQTHATGDQETQHASFTKNYIDFFPSFFVKYNPNESNEFGVNYSRRINRPRTWALNPFENRVDSLNITKGNSNLNPEYVNSFEVGYTKMFKKNSFTLTGFYRKTTSVISSVRTQISSLQSITTYYNLSSSVSYGGESSANINLLSWWNVNANYSYFHLKLSDNGSNILNSNAKESNSWTLRATSNWFATKDLSFQLMYNYKSPVVATGGLGGRGMPGGIQGKTLANYYFDMGARYSILKGKGDISLRVSDIFNTNKYIQDGFGNCYTSYTKSWREAPNAFLGFTYKINDFKRKPQKQQDSNNMDDEMM
jgi:Outer membrane receptor proteins, mostly Fe transport